MKVFWFDLETGGMDPRRHGIVQVAYALEISGSVVESGELRCNPAPKLLEDEALAVNGFTREQVAGFPPAEEVYRALEAVLSRYVDKYDKSDKVHAAGYNVAGFDVPFLRALWEDAGDRYFGSYFAYGCVDPMEVIPFLKWTGRLPGFPVKARLGDVAHYFGVAAGLKEHDASGDLALTMFISRTLAQMMSGQLAWPEGPAS